MSSPFQSPLELFAWSKHHFDILSANVTFWAERTPKVRITDFNPDTGETIYKFRFGGPLPWQIGAMAFDIAHTQRATLDHLMYASAIAINGSEPKKTKFPFGDETLESAIDNIRGVNGSRRRKRRTPRTQPKPHPNHRMIIAAALRFKPYKTGERDLWALNQIRNMKHHRLLTPTAVMSQHILIQNGIFVGGGIGLSPEWDRSSNELTYLRTTATFSHHDSEITPAVAFDESTIVGGRLVTEFFSRTGVLVQNIFKTIERKTHEIRRARGLSELSMLSQNLP